MKRQRRVLFPVTTTSVSAQQDTLKLLRTSVTSPAMRMRSCGTNAKQRQRLLLRPRLPQLFTIVTLALTTAGQTQKVKLPLHVLRRRATTTHANVLPDTLKTELTLHMRLATYTKSCDTSAQRRLRRLLLLHKCLPQIPHRRPQLCLQLTIATLALTTAGQMRPEKRQQHV